MSPVIAWLGSQQRIGMRENLKTCVVFGGLMATLYSGYTVVLYAIEGPAPFAKYGITVVTIVLAYYGAGILGGVLVGALFPLARWWVGRVVLTLIATFVAIFCAEIAMSGPSWRWGGDVWHELMMLTLIFGLVLSVILPRVSS